MRQRHMEEAKQQQEPGPRQADANVKPSATAPSSQASSAGNSARSAGAHSTKPVCNAGIVIRRSGWRSAKTPFGLHSEAMTATATKRPQRLASASRDCPAAGCSTASTRKEARQRQAEHKAAVQIGPQRHDRQHRPRRRAVPRRAPRSSRRTSTTARQRQYVRAGQQMRQHQHRSREGGDRRRQRRQAAEQERGENPVARAKPAAVRTMTPPQPAASYTSASATSPIHSAATQCAPGRVCDQVSGSRKRVMREHPAPSGDVEIGVGVVQQRRGEASARINAASPRSHGQDGSHKRQAVRAPGMAGARGR